MMIFCVSGKKRCGKTEFLEKLVAELVARGLRVGVVKNDYHGFDMDQPGKDTWRLKQAGASATLILGPEKVGLVMDVAAKPGLEDAARSWLGEMDLVLAEGFSTSPAPKIEVFRSQAHADPLLGPEDGLAAVVTDAPEHPAVAAAAAAGVPVFGLEDAALVAERLLSGVMEQGATGKGRG